MPNVKLTRVERRQDILQKAGRYFSLYGYDGVSMREIAVACRVNEALLYKHFKGKEDLFREVVKGLGEVIDGSLRKAAQAEPDGLSALRAVVKALVHGPEENLHVYAFLVHGMAASKRYESLRELVRGGFVKLNDFLQNLVERGIKDGTVKPDTDPTKCAWCILSRGLAARIITALRPEGITPEPSSDDETIEILVNCIASDDPVDRACSKITESTGS